MSICNVIHIPNLGIYCIVFFFDRMQYQQIMALTWGLAKLDRQKQMALYRPQKRPTDDPRGWWKYAYVLVTGKECSPLNQLQLLVEGVKHKKLYISLVKQLHRLQSRPPAGSTAPDNSAMIEALEAQTDLIEEQVPLPTLIRYRQLAALEIRSEDAKHKDLPVTSGNALADGVHASVMSVFSWVGGGIIPVGDLFTATKKKPTKPSFNGNGDGYGALDEDLPLEDLVSQLEQEVHRAEAYSIHHDITQFRLSFSGNTTVKLTNDELPLATLIVSLKALIDTKAECNVMSFYVENLCLIDEHTRNPISRYLIAARYGTSYTYTLYICRHISIYILMYVCMLTVCVWMYVLIIFVYICVY